MLFFVNNWRFGVFVVFYKREVSMKDVRISIRLTEEEHRKFKMFALKQNKKMQDILSRYIKQIIEKYKNE